MTDEIKELAALHSLGLLDAKESALLVHSDDPRVFAEIESFGEVTAELAELTAKAPPAGLKAKLMERIGATSDRRPTSPPPAQLPDGVVALVRATEGKWKPTPFPGITMKPLFFDASTGNQCLLVRMEAGSVYPLHHHEGFEHTYVLEGDAVFSDHTLYKGDYEVGQAHCDHSAITSKTGCLVFLMNNRADHVYFGNS